MKICIDPGHGGNDPGAVAGEVKEKDVVLKYAQELAAELRTRGHEILLTRVSDNFVGLSLRAQRSNEWGADCLVSVHANAASAAAANGMWVIYDDRSARDKGPALARAIFDELRMVPDVEDADEDVEVFADRTGWVGNRDLTVISKTRAPAVLVELGFLTNPDDLAQLLEREDMADIAVAIADGIEAWGGHEPTPVVDIQGDEPGEGGYRPQRQPGRERAHPLRRPVSEVARPGETSADFLVRVGRGARELLGPFARMLWDRLLETVLARVEDATDDVLDRVFGDGKT